MQERSLVIDGVPYALADGTDAEAALARLVAAVEQGSRVELEVVQERTPVVLHVNGRSIGTFFLLPEGTKPSSVQ